MFAGGRNGHTPSATQIWPKGPHRLSKQSRKPLGVAGRHFPVAQGAVSAKQTEQAFATGPPPHWQATGLAPTLYLRCSSASTSRFSRKGSVSLGPCQTDLVLRGSSREAQLWAVVRIPRPDLEVSRAARGDGTNTLLASLGHLVFHAADMHVPLASRSSTMRH